MRQCEWCSEEFEPTGTDQAYCKPRHAKNARLKRKKEKDLLAAAGKCPTPYKRVYVNEEHAQRRGLLPNQYLYRCSCGAIHSATVKTKKAAA
jgi:hypothetical protein